MFGLVAIVCAPVLVIGLPREAAKWHAAAALDYELDGKLIFIGEKDGAYFVVYDGEQVGPPFDLIVIGYCCEIALYAPRFGEERYMFWGQRESSSYVVEITSIGQAGR